MRQEANKASYELEMGPPPHPNRKKWPFVGTMRRHGLTIHIENLPGSYREGTDHSGKHWRSMMHWPYGEIHKTLGLDGDKVDVFVGPNKKSERVFVVNQNHPKGHPNEGDFDEQKVMLGFDDADVAKREYLRHYDNDSYFRSITEMDMETFKKSLKEERGDKIASLCTADACRSQDKLQRVARAYRSGLVRGVHDASEKTALWGTILGVPIGGLVGSAIGYSVGHPWLGAAIGAPVGGAAGGVATFLMPNPERRRRIRHARGIPDPKTVPASSTMPNERVHAGESTTAPSAMLHEPGESPFAGLSALQNVISGEPNVEDAARRAQKEYAKLLERAEKSKVMEGLGMSVPEDTP